MIRGLLRAGGCALLLWSGMFPAAESLAQSGPSPVDLTPFLRKDAYQQIKISPTGEYYAASVPLEDRTILVIIRRADQKPTAKIEDKEDTVIADFWWVNDNRVIASMAKKYGRNDAPSLTGELVAVDADGARPKWLTGPTNYSFALMHDTLRADADNVLITVVPYGAESETALETLNVYTGARGPVSAAPVANADFTSDHQGNARFAHGSGKDNVSKLYYRDAGNKPWRLVNDEAASGVVESAVGFSADGRTAYLRVERTQGPDAVVAMDTATGTRTELLRHPVVDPYVTLSAADGDTPVGALYMHDTSSTRFFDPAEPTAKYYRQLEKAFPGHTVVLTSATTDGKLLLFAVWSDRNPGDFYLYDTAAKKVEAVFSRRLWFDPDKRSPTRGVQIPARDGLMLHGYLTTPLSRPQDAPLPLVLLPHGGPFGIFDTAWFDDDAQLLADAGYAVLRVNYRGSGNYGRAFQQAGAREWGGRMQHDLTDATRWAIAQKIADPGRICIYGASYGGYAALMGVAGEPDLYRCAVGYVGVYDLEKRHRDYSKNSAGARNWADDWMGPREALAPLSPVGLADRIKVPVFLAAGGKDRQAPIEHTERMEKALKAAGAQVESLYYPNEGHGFYTEEHRREFYTKLLAFLSRHLGGATAK
jgi:dipeptidyl aminopeptidase/acylaminoacyl peptidase